MCQQSFYQKDECVAIILYYTSVCYDKECVRQHLTLNLSVYLCIVVKKCLTITHLECKLSTNVYQYKECVIISSF